MKKTLINKPKKKKEKKVKAQPLVKNTSMRHIMRRIASSTGMVIWKSMYGPVAAKVVRCNRQRVRIKVLHKIQFVSKDVKYTIKSGIKKWVSPKEIVLSV